MQKATGSKRNRSGHKTISTRHISRAKSPVTSLTRTTVFEIVADLIAMGLVDETVGSQAANPHSLAWSMIPVPIGLDRTKRIVGQ
jgi:hypothetical protein